MSTGIDFNLTPEQEEFRANVRKFVADEVIPVAAEYDRTMEYPWPVIKKAHAQGYLTADIPEAYGGLGVDMVSNCIISEEMAYGCSGIATAIMANDLAQTPLILCANDDIKKRFLGRMIDNPFVAVSVVFR